MFAMITIFYEEFFHTKRWECFQKNIDKYIKKWITHYEQAMGMGISSLEEKSLKIFQKYSCLIKSNFSVIRALLKHFND